MDLLLSRCRSSLVKNKWVGKEKVTEWKKKTKKKAAGRERLWKNNRWFRVDLGLIRLSLLSLEVVDKSWSRSEKLTWGDGIIWILNDNRGCLIDGSLKKDSEMIAWIIFRNHLFVCSSLLENVFFCYFRKFIVMVYQEPSIKFENKFKIFKIFDRSSKHCKFYKIFVKNSTIYFKIISFIFSIYIKFVMIILFWQSFLRKHLYKKYKIAINFTSNRQMPVLPNHSISYPWITKLTPERHKIISNAETES